MVDAVGDGDDGARGEDGRDKEEEEQEDDICGGVCRGLLVFENEFEDEGEEREGKEEDEGESEEVTRLSVYYAFRF